MKEKEKYRKKHCHKDGHEDGHQHQAGLRPVLYKKKGRMFEMRKRAAQVSSVLSDG